MDKQPLIIDVDSNYSLVIRFPGGFRQPYKRLQTAVLNAAKHVTANVDKFPTNAIVITTSAVLTAFDLTALDGS